MKRRIAQVILVVVALAVTWWGYGRYVAYRFLSAIDAALPLDTLRYFEFQPRIGQKLIRIDDPGSLAEVKAWLLRANKPGLASWPATTCALNFAFQDGHKEEIKISPTSTDGLNYGTVLWRGSAMIASDQPFSRILTKIDAAQFRDAGASQKPLMAVPAVLVKDWKDRARAVFTNWLTRPRDKRRLLIRSRQPVVPSVRNQAIK